MSEILRPLFKTLTPDEQDFPGTTENLRQRTEMKLSKKPKIFSESFTVFMKSIFNSKHFKRKDESHSLCFLELTATNSNEII